MADRNYLERLSRELADAGKLIEAGWIGYRLGVLPDNAPPVQLEECKMAFFAGSQHLFHSLITIMDPTHDSEPTPGDLRKMDLIDKELREFASKLALQASKHQGSA
jgi:hypothetical protein